MSCTLKNFVKLVSFAGAVFVIVVTAQFGQLLKSSVDVRNDALRKWSAEGGTERLKAIARFSTTCLKPNQIIFSVNIGSSDYLQSLEPLPPELKSCAQENDLMEVYEVIKGSVGIVHTTAWPLSLLPGSFQSSLPQ
ncbi:hypothetical protein [Thiopseudomonas alkaliphila]|uniref:hypothetical protein n=1 Tax=Thiopseudomonas alkaliphila TaxID=1697053 RepID=UPI0025790958|nr:hypothetical protein [Thiopseudomonas alkaliphila]MDM1717341.1 hypothetical protein [Thiopseudomonas alkaliphila]